MPFEANTAPESIDLHDFSWLETTKDGVNIADKLEWLLDSTELTVEWERFKALFENNPKGEQEIISTLDDLLNIA